MKKLKLVQDTLLKLPLMGKNIDFFANKRPFFIKLISIHCFCWALFSCISSCFAQIPSNTWRTHANYSQTKGLELIQNQNKIVKVYGFSTNGFFYFNPTDNSTQQTLSRIDGFSEATIAQIRYNASAKMLLIAYQSGILDFTELNDDGTPKAIHSIDFIKTTNAIQGSRNINQIEFQDNIAYLASDFGLVVLDITKREIKETYQNIGENGKQVAIKKLAFARDSIFVSTPNGILGAKFSPAINLQFYANWKKTTDNQLFITVVAPKDDLITKANEIEQDAFGKLWIADEKNGLISNFSGKFQQYSPNGVGQNIYQLSFVDNQIYAIGSETSVFNNNEWQKVAPNKVTRYSTEVIDIFGFRWKIMPNGIRVINETNKQFRNFTAGKGAGNLPSSSVYSLALDKEGLLWVGTGNGVAVIIPTKDIFSSTAEAYTPFYKTRRLLLQEIVTKIVVDGGNRKWIGTQNGLSLFSPSAEEQIYNFTEENSPLLSKNIIDLAIDSFSGELFILSSKGLVSYRTDATEASENLNEVKIFPNPVRPNFDGDLSISGLKENTFVKITDMSGRLIYETKSNGGTATWHLNNQFGNRAETGIYLIFCVDSNKNESFVGKVAVLK